MATSVTQPAHITRPTCARTGCNSSEESLKACTGCFLVHYCSTHCQKQAWHGHKSVCKSVLFKEPWDGTSRCDAPIRPAEVPPKAVAQIYDLENGYSSGELHMRTERWLFHCLPAVDVLQLNSQEAHSEHPIDILFAGSGDMVDFIKTVASLPMGAHTPPMRAVLNDNDSGISTRNVAILLLAMGSEDPKATAELVVQLWYSAFLPIGYLDRILEQLEPHMKNSPENELLNHQCPHQRAALNDPINASNDHPVLKRPSLLAKRLLNCCGQQDTRPKSKTNANATPSANNNMWTIGTCSLKYESTEMPDAFALLRPPFILGGNMLYPLRLNQYYRSLPKPWEPVKDFWHRELIELPVEWRVSRKAYFEERVLLPFGHDRNADWARPLKERKPGPENTGNWVQNPFYFGHLTTEFSMSSFSDPLGGWNIKEVDENKLAPKNDIYGKLFYFVRDLVEKFIVRLKSIKIDIEVYDCDTEVLKTKLTGQQFDRIHASNLADEHWMQTDAMLKSLSPLLKPKSSNPNARLISIRHEKDSVTKEAAKPFLKHFENLNAYIDTYGLGDKLRKPDRSIGVFMFTHSPLNEEQQEALRKWEEKRVRDLNRVGAPLGMEVVENTLTTAWPYGFRDGPLRGSFEGGGIIVARQITARFFEWQKTA
ncbi:hypothetical protein F5Y09DRAFT_353492 [Xylaria sp. FL1042]|nr:hypothetical protein F5Y09DRAFT_353492 [Xylaria sp. FL1042]